MCSSGWQSWAVRWAAGCAGEWCCGGAAVVVAERRVWGGWQWRGGGRDGTLVAESWSCVLRSFSLNPCIRQCIEG